MDDAVATLRNFNRSFTQRIGALDESFLDSGRTLGHSRLLYEIGLDGGDVLELRSRLGLDSGYVSRMLRQLETEKLIEVSEHPRDHRRREVDLTVRGRREWRRLDARSDGLAEALLSPLTDAQREVLSDALTTAERLLRAATISFEPTDPQVRDARSAMQQYFSELDDRFPGGFDPGHAMAETSDTLTPPTGAFLLATSDRETVGCGGVQQIDDLTGEIKRMWIHREWRGLGLGRRLLGKLEEAARELGYERAQLDTNSVLTVARAMYTGAGYQEIARYNDNPYARHWFAKEL